MYPRATTIGKHNGSKVDSSSLPSCAGSECHYGLQAKEITQAIHFHLFLVFIHRSVSQFLSFFWLFQQSTEGKDAIEVRSCLHRLFEGLLISGFVLYGGSEG